MSKRKKIFHKPDEKIPSTEEILNYLNEDTDNDQKEIFKDEDLKRSSPAPGMGGGVSKSSKRKVEEGGNKNKKRHELEKSMLADPLISDAVDGYALLNDKEKSRVLIHDINQSILKQTGRKNDQPAVMRIAAMI